MHVNHEWKGILWVKFFGQEGFKLWSFLLNKSVLVKCSILPILMNYARYDKQKIMVPIDDHNVLRQIIGLLGIKSTKKDGIFYRRSSRK